MDSRLDRYISNEYLVSPCPQPVAEPSSLAEVRTAVERAKEALEGLRSSNGLDEQASVLLAGVEKELTRVSALLDAADTNSWLA
jgi:hypothetical protein